MYRVGIDTGGTFTDLVAIDSETGELHVTKTSSTPENPIDGVTNSIEESNLSDGTGSISQLIHGTTVTTNALIERSGADVGYITTAGFEDVPFIQRINRKHHYSLKWEKPEPLVQRKNCFGVTERIDYKGNELEPLDESELRNAVRKLAAEGIDSFAVTFLFSHVNSSHEESAEEIILSECPDAHISLSHQVYSKWREYERASTTIADGYLKPEMRDYVDNFVGAMDSWDIDQTAIMKANGGIMLPEAAKSNPVHTITSGPAGGVISARYFGSQFGFENLVTFDMGGTSCDISVVSDGEQNYTTNFEIEFGLPINVPMIDIATIGAGGGSIAWVDEGGLLNVGPKSAGASPGPVCYGRGGTEPTVSDAHLVLGRINPEYFLGGKLSLDEEGAWEALSRLGDEIAMTAEEAAESIIQISNNNMRSALSSELVERGYDPKQFALIGFGGAGPLHAAELARKIGSRNVIVPVHPGVASATGLVMADGRVDYEQTLAMRSDQYDRQVIENTFESLKERALNDLAQEGFDRQEAVTVTTTVGMRYLGQNYEIAIPVGFESITDENISLLFEKFHDQHENLYGFSNEDEVIEIISFKVTAHEPTPSPALQEKQGGISEPKDSRQVYFENHGKVPTDIYDRDQLGISEAIDGPAIVEDSDSTTVIPPYSTFESDQYGNLLVEVTQNGK